LFLSLYWPLLNQAIFLEAAGAVLKINLSLTSKIGKFSLPKSVNLSVGLIRNSHSLSYWMQYKVELISCCTNHKRNWMVSLDISNIQHLLYCKLVKVRTLCILCNNCCLFRLGYQTPVWLGVALYTVLGQVSSPGQTDRLHINRDRSSLVIESIIYDNCTESQLSTLH